MQQRLKAWINLQPIEFILVIVIIVAAAIFRLYHIDQFMRFLGDEGRDALVVLHIVRDHHIPLIGPGTSVGNMYLGPWYYYLMAIPMSLTNLNPVAAAVQVGIIGTVTTLFIYYVGRRMLNGVAGLIAAACYAIFYLPVTTSRSSWNPYPMPFFALLTVYSLYQFVKTLRSWWLIVTAVGLGLALNMHLMGVLLMPLIAVFWLVALVWYKKQKASLSVFFLNSFIAVFVFLEIMSPLYYFDRRHGYINFHAFQAFLSNRETSVNLNPLNTLGKFWETFSDLYVSRLLAYGYPFIGTIISIVLAVAIAAEAFWQFYQRKLSLGFTVIVAWLVIGTIGMTLIKTHVYDHYFGFLFPAIFLLLGYFLARLWSTHAVTKWVVLLLTIGLIGLNLTHNALAEQPGNQLQRTQRVAQYVIDQTHGQKYNFALISRNNYFDAYEFYLTLWNHPFTMIDPEHFNQTIADKLVVVCEDPVCEPVNNDRAEISRFGWAKVDSAVQVQDVKVFTMSHTLPPAAIKP